MPNPKPAYTEEFRREAVRLYRSVKGERSLRSVSAELGISMESLRAWLKQAEIDSGAAPGLTTDERKRLQFLERENRILKEEREILKKAAAFFALESDPNRSRRSSS